MERKEIFIPFAEFRDLLKNKEMESSNLKGFRKGKAPELLMSFLHGEEMFQKAIYSSWYREMLAQMQEGWTIKDFKIIGVKLKNKNNEEEGWTLVVDIEKIRIEDKKQNTDENNENNDTDENNETVNDSTEQNDSDSE